MRSAFRRDFLGEYLLFELFVGQAFRAYVKSLFSNLNNTKYCSGRIYPTCILCVINHTATFSDSLFRLARSHTAKEPV